MTDSFDWKKVYARHHETFPGYVRKPIIGITGNFGAQGCELAEGYFRSVLEAGGIPLVIPPYEDWDALAGTMDRIDALLLSGGGDLNPLYVGEQPSPALHGINAHRDLPELLAVRLAYARQLPILGICRGIQVLTAALGGTLYQDIVESFDATSSVKLIKHSQDLDRGTASHSVLLAEGSLLRSLFGVPKMAVNSFHHQAVRSCGPHLRISAKAPDGIIEAVESNAHKPVLGVQWHPECFILNGSRCMMPLMEWLVDEAANYRKARDLHARILTLDSHQDTPMCFVKETEKAGQTDAHMFGNRNTQALVDLHKMTEGGLDAGIMVAYLPQGPRDVEGYKKANADAHRILERIDAMVEAHRAHAGIAFTPNDLYRLKHEGRRAVMKGIENGYALGLDLHEVDRFRQKGVVYMTLCHNGDNDLCDSARGNGEHNGVSPFGAEVIREMNRAGMMVDLSHASEQSFYDALSISRQPIVCSHSSSRALCNHPRNLTDDQLRALARKGGVAQVTFYHGFLRTDGEATIRDAVEHLNHMVRVAGIEHVGIGTDLDGDGGVPGMADASELINFTRHLLRARYSEEDLRLLWGENFLRVMRKVQASAHE